MAEEIVVIHDNKDTVVPKEQAHFLAKKLHVEPVFVDAEEEHFDNSEEPSMLPHILVETNASSQKEIKSFIADIVGVILQRYETAGSTIEEALESIRQEFAIDELPVDTKVRTI